MRYQLALLSHSASQWLNHFQANRPLYLGWETADRHFCFSLGTFGHSYCPQGAMTCPQVALGTCGHWWCPQVEAIVFFVPPKWPISGGSWKVFWIKKMLCKQDTHVCRHLYISKHIIWGISPRAVNNSPKKEHFFSRWNLYFSEYKYSVFTIQFYILSKGPVRSSYFHQLGPTGPSWS